MTLTIHLNTCLCTMNINFFAPTFFLRHAHILCALSFYVINIYCLYSNFLPTSIFFLQHHSTETCLYRYLTSDPKTSDPPHTMRYLTAYHHHWCRKPWLDQHQITHNTKPASLISTCHEDLERKTVLMQIWFRKTWLKML